MASPAEPQQGGAPGAGVAPGGVGVGVARLGRKRTRQPGEESKLSVILKSTLPPLVIVLLILAAWQIGSETGALPHYIFPPPTTVVKEIFEQPGLFWENAKTTLLEIALGGVIGIIFGFLIGSLIAMSRILRAAFYPLVVASQSVPILALAPLLILWLGFGIAPKIVIVVQIVFFPVAVAAIQGLSTVDPAIMVFGETLGASKWELFWKVRFPSMLPYLFAGLKISLSYAAIAAVIAEYIGATTGLGALMSRANSGYETNVLVAAVVLVTLIGLLLFVLTVLVERWAIPWNRRAPTK
jgi:ABC-type nitrate/sulfonate/bicarbonate transport system permease component